MKNENNFYVIRGKTDRRRKRETIRQKEKQLIQLDKKESQLYTQRNNLGFELLEKPYQKGSYTFNKIPEKFKQYFLPIEEYHPNFKTFITKYKFIEPWKYVLKIEPNMITKRRKIDIELEQELSQIKNKIERNHLRIRINKAKSKKTNYKEWKVADNKKLIPLFKIVKQEYEQY